MNIIRGAAGKTQKPILTPIVCLGKKKYVKTNAITFMLSDQAKTYIHENNLLA
jgi:hypothetical protein